MQLLRSTNVGFHLVMGTNHILVINTAESVCHSFRTDAYKDNIDWRGTACSVRSNTVPSISVW